MDKVIRIILSSGFIFRNSFALSDHIKQRLQKCTPDTLFLRYMILVFLMFTENLNQMQNQIFNKLIDNVALSI